MFTRTWATSGRDYGIRIDRDVRAPMSDGTLLDGDVYRPAASGRFPIILGISPYNKHLQSPPMMPVGFTPMRGYMESGDPTFYARRGYVHAIFNVRGTGASEGSFGFNDGKEVEDVAELIEWLAEQPWSNGNVGIFGVSYYAKLAKGAAHHGSEPLKAIFAPFSVNDWYRHVWYPGGILAQSFLSHWRFSPHRLRYRSTERERLGDNAYRAAIAEAQDDPEIVALPTYREALRSPEQDTNGLLVDIVINKLLGPFWDDRHRDNEIGEVPAYLGACWGNYGLHLPGAFTSYADWRGPKRLMIGPPLYLDRPLYQLAYESLRWFDYWLKGIDTKIMEDPPIRAFMPGTGDWRELEDWPPPEARWTPFFLHDGGLLSEHELWPGEGVDSFNESPFEHGSITYTTPPFVEKTEVLGPSVLTVYLSSSDTDVLLFVTLLSVDPDGKEQELTRGWLRASHRRLVGESAAWMPVHTHRMREPLEPGEVYELKVPIVETSRVFAPGERLALRISGSDLEEASTSLEALSRNHVLRPHPSRITIHHDQEFASRLELPITRGNVLGTFMSGGDISQFGLSGRSPVT